MATTPEGRVKAKVKEYLKARGIWWFMPVSNGMGSHGIPDIIAIIDGRFVGIECKAPGKRNNTSELQKTQIAAINAAGGLAIVIDDPEQLPHLLHPQPERDERQLELFDAD
jgi:hypothetical protein